MKHYVIAGLLLFYGADALADSQAVQETTFQTGFASGDTYTSGGSDSSTYGINGGVTFPLATYVGASLSGAYAHSNLATNFSSETHSLGPANTLPACSINHGNLDAGLFLRNPTIGKVGIGYGVGRARSGCSATFLATGTDTLETKNYTANAEYYFSKMTIAVAGTRTHLDAAGNLNSDTLTASWYSTNNVRVALSADGLDFKNTYSLGLEYQPEFLENSTSLLFGYTTQRQTIETRSIMVGFSYYFDKRVDLITRDRQYR